MPNLVDISREVMKRTDEGREAFLAVKAIKEWKNSPAIQSKYPKFIDYYDQLVSEEKAKSAKVIGGKVIRIPPPNKDTRRETK